MKSILFVVLAVTLFSCGNTKEVKEVTETIPPPPEEMNMAINDIWVAETFFGERYEPNGSKTPQMEIHIKEMRFAGNDGCNNLSGSIKKLDNSNLVFGNSASTKMACQDMLIPERYQNVLLETRTYKIEKLRLYLFNADGTELMVLKKVD